MATHPPFYVGLFKPYHQGGLLSLWSDWVAEYCWKAFAVIRTSSSEGSGAESGAGAGARAATRRASWASKILTRSYRVRIQSRCRSKTWRTDASFFSPCEHQVCKRTASSSSYRGKSHTRSRRKSKYRRTFWSFSRRASASRREREAPGVADRTQQRVEGPPGQGVSQSVDAERPGPTPPPLRAPPPLLGNEVVLYYHVEKLLKRRGRSGQYQYLVKWRGYPSSRNSWEPGARLEEDCADLVAAFERAHGPGRC
ncbi:hypothetical protein PF005_g2540 [Phytophthora fragariae]|uniref:Chromo domain-containing protein n=1 Tax=Phytophthora fragariae TaxID=53985 RepID=A0A6A3LIV8_9STRA|nr:hypothetical protein PF003_g1599 [Phytophthora fragariae]KAE8944825.1 hypothetical protein PF009_g5486 [Phytophthora fragariae]KAE9015733.1 hypothetical protein PF011_g7490 [Phytophthora fragariae]KAE9087207.1 hypothetical protein PF006_g25858 [Phytophthora fragariae]KAE9127918.1 hypothetical protein PF010_g4695 [Phytophthora fragariae]